MAETKKPQAETPTYNEKITDRILEKEMHSCYMDYAMSVIVGRALPDVRDGFKPVHRRVLFGMYELSNTHDKPYKKSARVVGEVMGKYHPHGDSAIYDTIVRMAQSFSLRMPLVDGQGNFGSVDGDSPAAMRYTEVRLHRLADEMLADLEKETVDFVPNFDETLKEPTCLPAKFPNLLVNGSAGIAVGMATNIPPHNLAETIDGVIALIDNPEAADAALLSSIVRGPDFPTGGIILGRAGILEAYASGRGSVRVRGRAEIIDSKKEKGRKAIVVSEIPYQVNKAELVKTIAELARDKKIEGIADVQDLSDKDGMEIRIEVKRDASPEIVLNSIYAKTQLETSFGIINLALVDNEPKTLPLRDMLLHFLKHRQVVVRRRCTFDLNVAKDRKHILEGLKIALSNIDAIIEAIKKSSDAQAAKAALTSRWSLSDKQAAAILDTKLQRLTSLERNKIDQENAELAKTIDELTAILADEKKILSIIKDELLAIKEKYPSPRRTEIQESADEEIELEDLIPDEPVAIVITENDYIKRMPLSEYKAQKRGGRGILGAEIREEDRVKDIIIAHTHDTLLFFTNVGIAHWLKAHRIPSTGRYSAGKPIVNLLDVQNERVASWIPVRKFTSDEFLVMVTKKGVIKRTSLENFARPRRGGIIAITLRDGDGLVEVRKTDGKQEILIATKNGQSIRFDENDAREIGRTGQGVRGIDVADDDEVVGFALCKNPTVLTITENGYGKRTPVDEYRLQNRGGSGIINIKTEGRNGHVIGVKTVSDEDEILLISSGGKVIRIAVKDISVIGRNTQGVRIMKLEEKEKVIGFEHFTPEMGENGNGSASSSDQNAPANSETSSPQSSDAATSSQGPAKPEASATQTAPSEQKK